MFEKEDILKFAPKHFTIFKEEVQERVIERLLKEANNNPSYYSLLQLFKSIDNMNVETALEDEWLPKPEEIQNFTELGVGTVKFDEEIEIDESKVTVLLEPWFNVDRRFGISVETTENNDYINLYLVYDLTSQKAEFQVIHYRGNNHYAVSFGVLPNEKRWLIKELNERAKINHSGPVCAIVMKIR